MASSSDGITGVAPIQQAVPPGISLAVFIADPAFVQGSLVKYVSGGSLFLLRCTGDVNGSPSGSTVSAASLVAAYNAGEYYNFDASALSINGSARYYLAAVGSTAVCQIVRGLGTGYTN